MTRLMIITGSVRPVRIGGTIADWVVRGATEAGFDVDAVDLRELQLPFMDEAAHPVLRQYEHAHTKAWSERVEAAEAFVFVTPEYNHASSPALQNAIDYLAHEWNKKPVGFVSYGGVSGGTRGVEHLMPRVNGVGLIRVSPAVEIPFARLQLVDDVFEPTERQQDALTAMLAALPAFLGLHEPLPAVP